MATPSACTNFDVGDADEAQRRAQIGTQVVIRGARAFAVDAAAGRENISLLARRQADRPVAYWKVRPARATWSIHAFRVDGTESCT